MHFETLANPGTIFSSWDPQSIKLVKKHLIYVFKVQESMLAQLDHPTFFGAHVTYIFQTPHVGTGAI